MATPLNSANLSDDIPTTPGKTYLVATTGTFDGATVSLSRSLTGSPAEFAPVAGGEFSENFEKYYGAGGAMLRLTVTKPGGVGPGTVINYEITEQG